MGNCYENKYNVEIQKYKFLFQLVTEQNQWLTDYPGFPFLWMALHWLAMSHSCYNPVIYCWMNARFREGFIIALSRFPGVSCFVPDRDSRAFNSSAGIPLTGKDIFYSNFSLLFN